MQKVGRVLKLTHHCRKQIENFLVWKTDLHLKSITYSNIHSGQSGDYYRVDCNMHTLTIFETMCRVPAVVQPQATSSRCLRASDVWVSWLSGGLDYLEERGGKRSERRRAPGVGDVTALATACLSEAGARGTWINLGKQWGDGGARRERRRDGDDEHVYEQREDAPFFYFHPKRFPSNTPTCARTRTRWASALEFHHETFSGIIASKEEAAEVIHPLSSFGAFCFNVTEEKRKETSNIPIKMV